MMYNLDEYFQITLKQQISSLGYKKYSQNFFAREISINTFGCFGYLLSGTNPISIKPIVGIRFEHVERVVDDLNAPFRTAPKSTSKYFPTLWQDLFQLEAERSIEIGSKKIVPSYIQSHRAEIPAVCEKLISFYLEYGESYVQRNSALESAAATMARGNGGGIGSVARSLPVIYWMLGRADEAKKYMADIVGRGYPIGPYEEYAVLLTARMEAGPAPFPQNVN